MKPLVQLATTQRSTRYRLTPTLSVDAPQLRLIWPLLTAVAVSVPGTVGACGSDAAGAVSRSPNTVSWLVEPTNTFPFATSGVMNFAPTGSVSRAPAWLLLYNSASRLLAS